MYSGTTDAGSIWAVRPIDSQSEQELIESLERKELYLPYLRKVSSENRRLEWLSIRVLLKELLGKEVEILYDPSGKPFLADSSFQISISHTAGYIALILNEKFPVGIDIETIHPRIEKIRHRFMSTEEETNLSPECEAIHLLLHWSAKECMFKILPHTGIDFKETLHIHPFEPLLGTLSTFSVHETRTKHHHSFQMHYLVAADFVLTFCEGEKIQR